MKNRKVTNEEREEILRRTREGGKDNLQKQIAADLRLNKSTIRKVQAEHGLRPHPGYCISPDQERAVLALFLAGHGQPHISSTLNIPSAPVREVILRFRDRQARGQSGYRYEFSALEKRGIKRDLREARRAVARKWKVTLPWIKEFEALQRQDHRNVHEAMPFLPKAADLLRVLRALLPNGIPFTGQHDRAAIEGLMQGVGVFVSLPTKYAAGLRSHFSEALSMLRRERSGEWIH